MNSILDLNKMDSKKLYDEVVNKINECNDSLNAFNLIVDYKHVDNKDSLLNGVCYALKDNVATKGILTTACSNTLKDFIPPYSATIYEKLEKSGAVLTSKTNLDELAMGGTGTTGNTGVVHNPWNINKIAGGSSSGSAVAVAKGIVPFAIGSDTGDSIRKPAAFCGVVGFKPSYGLISRYGLFSFASSLDHLGVFTNNVMDAAIVIDAVKGYDEKDMTSINTFDNVSFYENIDKNIKNKKLFYIEELLDESLYKEENSKIIYKNYFDLIENLKKNDFTVEGVNIDKDLLLAIKPVYDSLSCAEATSNDSNLTGIGFGPESNGKTINERMKDFRTKGFSSLIKRRFVIGSFVLQKENQEKYFLNAKRVRRLIVEKFNELFTKYDGLILPCSQDVAPDVENSNNKLTKADMKTTVENHMAIGNFGGYPSITIPCGKVDNMPIGVNITSGYEKDIELLSIALKLENIIGGDSNE